MSSTTAQDIRTGSDRRIYPLGSRIIAVADSFEAMISERPYRKAMPGKEALDEILNSRGTQFDPAVAGVLLGLYGHPHAGLSF